MRTPNYFLRFQRVGSAEMETVEVEGPWMFWRDDAGFLSENWTPIAGGEHLQYMHLPGQVLHWDPYGLVAFHSDGAQVLPDPKT